eukprot:scaffold47223_cov32-Phaeocystis_antarctica.AAC.1
MAALKKVMVLCPWRARVRVRVRPRVGPQCAGSAAQPRPTGGERLPSATFGPERAEVGQTTLLLPHEA